MAGGFLVCSLEAQTGTVGTITNGDLGLGLGQPPTRRLSALVPDTFLKNPWRDSLLEKRVRLLIAATQLPGEFQPASFIVLGRPE